MAKGRARVRETQIVNGEVNRRRMTQSGRTRKRRTQPRTKENAARKMAETGEQHYAPVGETWYSARTEI